MKSGPGDIEIIVDEIGEIGMDEIFEGIIPGSEPVSTGQIVHNEKEETPSGIDDPLGDIIG